MIDIAMIGLLAGTLTTGSQVPQALKIWRTGSTGDLSSGWILALLAGTVTWLCYGLLISDAPLILFNGASVFIVGYIAAVKFAIIKNKNGSPVKADA